ncbi:hypothetical protein QWY87_16850 [Lutimonas halocynthiae]|uniref:hypothetical protein n=1 Tax=Lutimonas halocynthiae TaxID=1446477 RepID=UPI0025B47741|nr:hypothetical protein [Lutimonas halocynthiae]MDN3644386.1 hypothetical protein [Lutimonas halocynthiae]
MEPIFLRIDLKEFLTYVRQKLAVEKSLLLLYIVVYASWGIMMDRFGTMVEIARFTYWWQIITVYILYMIPISLLLRGLPFYQQYAYGLVFMSLLEFGGYAIESSYAYPNNLLDQYFGIRNFSLGMALFFALYFPTGNWLVNKIHLKLFAAKD